MHDKSQVTFLNKPKLSGHLVDEVLDEGRISLLPQIEKFILNNILFENQSVDVSFFHTGVSNLVSLLETEDKKYILKVKLRPAESNMEAIFLEKWESAGIKVPHIYEKGMIENHAYILMEYISADILFEAFNLEAIIASNKLFEMGQMLKKMHTIKKEGFGQLNSKEVPEYASFKDWVSNNENTKNQIFYVKENNLLPEEIFGSMDNTINTLTEYIDINPKSTYCHFDFSPGNILNTNPLTVFDPVCIINHPYLDLAKSIIQSIALYLDPKPAKQIIDGYFANNKDEYNKEILDASLLFIAYTKFPYWNKKNKIKEMDVVKSYLETII